MNQEFNTIELARVYESQGHFKKALDIYKVLDGSEPTKEIKAGISRIEKRLEGKKTDDNFEIEITNLVEEWFNLIVLKHRAENIQKITRGLSENE